MVKRVSRSNESPESGGPTISLVLPCFNEAANLTEVFGKIPSNVNEVLFVDGGSVDGSVERALELRPDIRVLTQHAPGKGLALVIGLLAATSDIVVMADTDCSTDLSEMNGFVNSLVAGSDYVKGTRHVSPGGSDDFTIVRRIGNLGLVKLVNFLYRVKLTDVTYGYGAFWTDTLEHLRLDQILTAAAGASSSEKRRPRVYGHGFEIEVLLACRTAKAGFVVSEIPCHEHLRRHGISKLTVFRDGFRNLHAILFERFGPPSRAHRASTFLSDRMAERLERLNARSSENGSVAALNTDDANHVES